MRSARERAALLFCESSPSPHLRIHPPIGARGPSPRDSRDLRHSTRARKTLVQKELRKQEERFHKIQSAELKFLVRQG